MNKKVLIGVTVAVVIVAAVAVSMSFIKPKPATNQPAVNVNSNTGLANPASTFCVNNGGRVEIRTADDGSQAGACVFTDGSSCDEWAYFRGECMPLQQQGTSPAGAAGINVSEDQGNIGTEIKAVLYIAADAKLGNYLTASNGLTLYTYAKDSAGVSNCADQCAINWPVYAPPADQMLLTATGINGKISTITRADDVVQVTYNDLPLYFWKGDAKAGDISGEGVGGTWTVAKP